MDRDMLVHKYFKGNLTDEEYTILMELLENDSEFKAEFSVIKRHHATFINQNNYKQTTEGDSKASSFFLRYAVVACIIIGASVFLSKNFINTVDSDTLFEQNFIVYKNTIQPLKKGAGLKNSQEEAFFKYEIEDYKTAIKAFQSELSRTKHSYYLLYIANAHLGLGNAKQAIPLLEEHQKFRDNFYDESIWYLALAYLKEKNIVKCKTLLQKIVDTQGYQYKKAEVFLQAIH